MNGENTVEIKALWRDYSDYKDRTEKTHDEIREDVKEVSKVHNLDMEKLENKIMTVVREAIGELRKSQNRLLTVGFSICGFIIALLIGVVGWLLNTGFIAIMEKLTQIP